MDIGKKTEMGKDFLIPGPGEQDKRRRGVEVVAKRGIKDIIIKKTLRKPM